MGAARNIAQRKCLEAWGGGGAACGGTLASHPALTQFRTIRTRSRRNAPSTCCPSSLSRSATPKTMSSWSFHGPACSAALAIVRSWEIMLFHRTPARGHNPTLCSLRHDDRRTTSEVVAARYASNSAVYGILTGIPSFFIIASSFSSIPSNDTLISFKPSAMKSSPALLPNTTRRISTTFGPALGDSVTGFGIFAKLLFAVSKLFLAF